MMDSRWDDPYSKRESRNYDNPIPSREFLIDYIKKLKKPVSYKKLVKQLALKNEAETSALQYRLNAMVRDAQLFEVSPKRYKVVTEANLVKGKIQSHREGYGYLVPYDDSPYLYLSTRQMNQVLDGDIVLARRVRSNWRSRQEVAIVKVIEHAHQEVVGRYFYEGEVSFVEPMNKRLFNSIVISPKQQHLAKNGDMVVVKIIVYPTIKSSTVGEIIEILGHHMAAGMEIDVAIRTYNIPYQWPKELAKLIKKFDTFSISKKEKKNRIDLCHLPFVTIDGENAKDFDDAVFCQKRRSGWRLYVAIADVSYFVKPNTALDDIAFDRGTSVYFPGQVIPMLPEILSNDLCSLKPNVERLALMCDMKISYRGIITSYELYPAIICSKERLTYHQVNKLFLNNKHSIIDESVISNLKNLRTLYHALYKNRCDQGAIFFNTTEINILFDEQRKIQKLEPVIRNDAHKLIEECMLCANKTVAKFLIKHKIPTLYRVHTGPKIEVLDNLRIFLKGLGLSLGDDKKLPSAKNYADLIDKVKQRADEDLIHIMLLKSMSRAFYTPNNQGHFSLVSRAYTHFTSPIRRYPDLLVHRAIKVVLNHDKSDKKLYPSKDDFIERGEHCSATERRADHATRDALSWLKCEYMLSKIGKKFTGIISTVTSFGFFVQIEEILIEGLVHISTLPQDGYQFDIARQRLQGRHHVFRLGDELVIKVVDASIDERRISFVLADKKYSARKSRKRMKAKR